METNAHHAIRQRAPRGSADGRQQQDFAERLPYQPPARRTQSEADRDIALAHDGARQHQVGHVGAGDQKHRQHRAK
jgi:hypothetical protein